MSAELVYAFRPQPFASGPPEWFYVCDEGAWGQAFIDDVSVGGQQCDSCGSKGESPVYRLRSTRRRGQGYLVFCEHCDTEYRALLMPADQVVFPS